MFGRIKKWLGIEGIKMRLLTLDVYPRDVDTLNGELEFISQGEHTISFIRLKLVEKYIKGRGDNVEVEEYELGRLILDQPVRVTKDQPQTILFKIPFDFVQSPIEKMASKGPLRRGIASLAKSFKGVRSEFRVEVEAVLDNDYTIPMEKRVISFQ